MGILLIDIGNTVSKIAFFDEQHYQIVWRGQSLTIAAISSLEETLSVNRVALSAVGAVDDVVVEYLRDRYNLGFLEFRWDTPIPIANNYSTPETLGADRVLAAVAAWSRFCGSDILIIDCGSAITIDFLSSDGCYQGGNISAGIPLRLKALNQLTHNLPLVESYRSDSLLGKSTSEAIANGVYKGILYEIGGYINDYRSIYPDLKVLFTGGDAKLLVEQIECDVYNYPFLVFEGLKILLDYNAED